ncbi:MAG TPA: PucR family transcriptional regulator, partial [Lachnospiraceae bacterium]|nr:PucR family transcriptional regulator [Lachnospiraceae bacterium]
GWSNSISWLLMVEDLTIVQRFSGKELAVTTCLGFQEEEKLHLLMEELVRRQASGLIINTGCYIREVPAGIRKFADDNALPLLTVPWDIEIAEMIKDLSIRI